MSEYAQDINYQVISELNPDVIGIPQYITNEELVYSVCIKLKSLFAKRENCSGRVYSNQFGKQNFSEMQ